MKSSSRVRQYLIVVSLVVLAGCSKTILTTPEPEIAFNPVFTDTSAWLHTESVSFQQVAPRPTYNGWYRWDYYQVSTHAFDPSVSGLQLDTLMSDLTRYELWNNSDQMNQSANVTIRSLSTCYLDSSEAQITWNTSMSGLVYNVRQRWSWRYDMIDGEMISMGDQKVLAFTIKNTSANLIQFSGSSNCWPIAPYGYARWYIARPMLDQLGLTYDYAGRSGSWSLTQQNYNIDIDHQNPANQVMNSQAFPRGTILSISTPVATIQIVSWSMTNSWVTRPLTIQSDMIRIDTSWLDLGRHEITLEDQRWASYLIDLLVYDRITLSKITVNADQDKQWYYYGYQTQSPAIVIDHDATDRLLARAYSWVRIADNIWFDNCYGANCFAFDIKIQSGQKVSSVTVMDQFGVTGSVDLAFTMWAIKESLQSATIRWDGINLLTQWVWDNAIQMDYVNIDKTTLYYYPCEWKPQADITKQLDRAWYDNWYGAKMARLEDLLFDCNPKSYNQPVTSATTRYRDPQVANLKVPSQLATAKAFAVKTAYTKSNASQLFIQTQIGIYAKQSSDQVYVWLFDLQTGAPITWSATLKLYQLNPQKWRSSSWSLMISSWPYITSTSSRWEMTALTAQVWSDWWFVTLWWAQNQSNLRTRDRSIDIQSAIRPWDVSDSSITPTRWYNADARIYGYTDRWLYKPGDQLFVAWWYRELSDIGSRLIMTSWQVTVSVHPASDWSIITLQRTGIQLDQYGGFNISFDIPADIAVDDYVIEFTAADNVSYTQTIKINEYQKPTFFINQTLWRSGDNFIAQIRPDYYFWAPLQWWTYRSDWSLAAQSWWRWWRDDMNQSDYYYDMRLEYRGNTTSLAGTIAGGWSTQAITSTLFTGGQIPSESTTLKLSTVVTDLSSDETHVVTDYQTISPLVSIWLWGSPYDWYYDSTISTLKPIKYILSGMQDKIVSTSYTWYYFDWKTQSTTQGIDGSLYYNGSYYAPVISGSLTELQWSIATDVISKPGDWLLVVQSFDADGREIGHNEHSIWYADGDWYNYGSLNNNYTLTTSIDQIQYNEGQNIPINITPYIKWATVLITVEQWDRIIDTYIRTLDGWQITIPAKASYYPSTMVSVTQIAWYDLVNQSSSKIRREPRMWQWYAQVKINQNLFKLNIDISTDKQQYVPGEKMTLTIKTTDYQGKLVDARLSVGIVDKSLNDLYSYFKSPLSDFFLSLGTTWTNYTNMKWLYQWLKVFTQEGSKWWWGGGNNPLWFLRQKFEDVAYWRWWVYTKDGVWTTTLTLPDNLTTWTIDVMGITRSTQVWTITKDIIATKDLIIQPNLPLYVTIGDHIDMPVKVLGITQEIIDLADSDVSVTTTIKTIDDQVIATHTTTTKLNGSTIVPLIIDPKRYQYSEIIIETDARIGDYHDAAREIIPLRTNGLTQQSLKTVVLKQWSLIYPLTTGALSPQLTLSIGQIPIISLDHQLDYMIRYPYGCAEQTVSTLAGLLWAKSLTQYGLFTDYFSGDMVTPQYDRAFSLSSAITDAKTRLWTYQTTKGGFGYWNGSETYYTLSAYIYSVMMQYPQLYAGYETKLTDLERYLNSNGGADNPDQYLYYLYQKSRYRWWVNLAQVQQIIDFDKTARVAPELLGAAIALNMNDIKLATKRFNKLNLDDFDGRQSEYGPLYPLLTPRSALLIYQSLIDKLASKPTQLHNELIVSLMRQRNADGIRWYSTVDNLAALTMLGVYRSHRSTAPISCTLTRANKQETITLTSWQSRIKTIDTIDPNNNLLERSCNDSVIVDSKLTSVMTTIPESMLTKHNVEYLQRAIPAWLQPGQMTDAIAQFKITQPAPHTAIELYIPASYKLWDVINAKQTNSYDLPFVVDGWYSCRPDHYEVRFDRLFLYYNTLEANQSCRITIPILKAYSGDVVIMPSKFYQMYDDSVYATVLPTIK